MDFLPHLRLLGGLLTKLTYNVYLVIKNIFKYLVIIRPQNTVIEKLSLLFNFTSCNSYSISSSSLARGFHSFLPHAKVVQYNKSYSLSNLTIHKRAFQDCDPECESVSAYSERRINFLAVIVVPRNCHFSWPLKVSY